MKSIVEIDFYVLLFWVGAVVVSRRGGLISRGKSLTIFTIISCQKKNPFPSTPSKQLPPNITIETRRRRENPIPILYSNHATKPKKMLTKAINPALPIPTAKNVNRYCSINPSVNLACSLVPIPSHVPTYPSPLSI